MIALASIVVGLLAGAPAAASQPSQIQASSSAEGTCRSEAIARALETAPGIDEGSSATVIDVHLLSVVRGAGGLVVETYYVKTEDQGGMAASHITVQFRGPSFIPELLRCNITDQVWVE